MSDQQILKLVSFLINKSPSVRQAPVEDLHVISTTDFYGRQAQAYAIAEIERRRSINDFETSKVVLKTLNWTKAAVIIGALTLLATIAGIMIVYFNLHNK